MRTRLIAFWQHHPFRFTLGLALLVRLCLWAVACLGTLFPVQDGRFPLVDALGRHYRTLSPPCLDLLLRWDAPFYLELAAHGYAPPNGPFHVAFFPLYPLGIAALSGLGLPPVAAALVLANGCDLLAWWLFADLLRRRLPPAQALAGLLLFAFFPGRQFAFCAYSEGPFLLLAIGAFCLYERRQVALAAGLCALASAVRPPGLAVGLALGLEGAVGVWRRQPGYRWRQLLPLALAPLGLLAFMAHLQVQVGDPLAFMHIQHEWGRRLQPPWAILFSHGEWFDHLSLYFAGAVGWHMVRRRAPVRDLAFVALCLAPAVASGSIKSMLRFVGVCFPLFIALPELRPSRRQLVLYLLLTLFVGLLLAFKLGRGANVV